ncbi:MAG: flagellar hook-basal body complex protein FliE [Candidatus Muiribacteriota bacterium]|jgi:flagellar hook-basal body complex protein FliE
MSVAINPFDLVSSSNISTKVKPQTTTHSRDMVDDFKNLFMGEVKKTVDLQKHSSEMTNKMVAGDVEDIHQVMIAAEKAKIAFKFTLEVKNKILQAYQELQRVQL